METIGIFVGPYSEYWDENTVAEGMGGSETWAIELGKQFVARGYEVTVYAYPEENHDVIPNFHLVRFDEYLNNLKSLHFDYFIYSRLTSAISPYVDCKNKYVMAHDTCLVPNQDTPYNIGIGSIKAYCALSDWHKENLLNLYKQCGINEYMIYQVTNGFSTEYYTNIDLSVKENCMVWSSCVVRGFDQFYKWVVIPILLRYPDFKVYIATYGASPEEIKILDNAKLLPGVEVLGKLSKEKLAEYQRKSKIWVYPGIFPETFCITAIENCAAGSVAIAPMSFGLATTLKGLPYIEATNLPILSKDTANLYVNSICTILENDDIRLNCARQCIEFSKRYSWTRTADEFINLFNQTKQ